MFPQTFGRWCVTLERRNKVFDIIITHSIAEGHPRLCQTVQCGIFYSYSTQSFIKSSQPNQVLIKNRGYLCLVHVVGFMLISNLIYPWFDNRFMAWFNMEPIPKSKSNLISDLIIHSIKPTTGSSCLMRISLMRFFKTITKIWLMRFYGLFILLLRTYRISANSSCGNYSFWVWSYVLWPLVTVRGEYSVRVPSQARRLSFSKSGLFRLSFTWHTCTLSRNILPKWCH